MVIGNEASLDGSHQLAAFLAGLLVELLVLLVLGPRQDSDRVTATYAHKKNGVQHKR